MKILLPVLCNKLMNNKVGSAIAVSLSRFSLADSCPSEEQMISEKELCESQGYFISDQLLCISARPNAKAFTMSLSHTHYTHALSLSFILTYTHTLSLSHTQTQTLLFTHLHNLTKHKRVCVPFYCQVDRFCCEWCLCV